MLTGCCITSLFQLSTVYYKIYCLSGSPVFWGSEYGAPTISASIGSLQQMIEFSASAWPCSHAVAHSPHIANVKGHFNIENISQSCGNSAEFGAMSSCLNYVHNTYTDDRILEHVNILWRIDPLLDNDREINSETTAVGRQRQARQWTGWKAVFLQGPRRWLRTQQWIQQQRNCVFCAVCA
jgi:hypothetical protein